ncbi:hypothetical protein [Catellatospora methionotrophica]|uniref:hypothetical protein n=1 Tax=Catellatospora methionotrophica TaxID=121620 RepID=UPI0033C6EA3A
MRRLVLPLLFTAVLATAAACAGSSPDTTALPSPVASVTSAAPSPSPSPDSARDEVFCEGRKVPQMEIFKAVALYAGFANGNYQGGAPAMKKVLGELRTAVGGYRAYLATALKTSTDTKLAEALTADVDRLDAWSKKLAAPGTDYDGKVFATISDGWTAFSEASAVSALCSA